MDYKFAATSATKDSTWRPRRESRSGALRVVVAACEEHRSELRTILQAHEGVRVIGESADRLGAIEKIARLRPDLVFLDMQMDGADGFDALDNLDHLPEIVLTSSLQQHALRAYEANALDFLLKPISADRVNKAISRARKLLAPAPVATEAFDLFAQTPNSRRTPSVSRLAVQKGKRVILLNLKDIYCIKVESRLVFAFTGHDRYLVNRRIMELDELLRDNGFFQINRATVINLEYLVEIIPWFSGTCKLRLANETEFHLSRDRVSTLKATVGLAHRRSRKIEPPSTRAMA